jgi:hypothetical protein
VLLTLVGIQHNLEEILLLESLVLVLLSLRVECIDWPIELLLREGQRVDAACDELGVIGQFERLRDYL